MIPCNGFIEEVLSVDADADADTDAGRIPLAYISHPPPFMRVTKNRAGYPMCYHVSIRQSHVSARYD